MSDEIFTGMINMFLDDHNMSLMWMLKTAQEKYGLPVDMAKPKIKNILDELDGLVRLNYLGQYTKITDLCDTEKILEFMRKKENNDEYFKGREGLKRFFRDFTAEYG